MRTTYFVLTSLLLWFLHPTLANPLDKGRPAIAPKTTLVKANSPSVNELIRSSFRTGNAQDLALNFDKQLELLIDSEAVDFSEVRAKHAELILKTFFRKHPPQDFQYVYQGGSAHLRYITGLYQTAGQRFSVYLLMRQDSRQRFVINTLHLRKG